MLVYYEYDLKLMQIFTFGRNTFKDHLRNQRNFLAGNQKWLLRYLLILLLLLYSYCIQNGNRTKWRPIPSVRFHMSDELNQTTVKRESDLFISRMITDRTGWHKVLLPINQNYDKFVKETRHRFYIFIKKRKEKKKLTWQNATQQHMQMMYSVHLHWHDVLTFSLTVLLHCPIRSMMCTVSY